MNINSPVQSCTAAAKLEPCRSALRLSLILFPVLMSSGALGQSGSAGSSANSKIPTAQEASDIAAETQRRVDAAIPIVKKMTADPQANELLGKAKGIFIVPNYLQAALVFGGRGGSGVLLVRTDTHWSNPAFYKIGGGSFGAQIGGTKGALVLLLMSDKAINAFENNPSTWSLSAGAGLTAVSYSRQTPESQTLSDVVVWSDTKGLFGGAAVGASKMTRDTTANQVYYNNRDVTTQQILTGAVANPGAKPLVAVMPAPHASKQ
jgi:lipid-binding SYLF domain-containing protein